MKTERGFTIIEVTLFLALTGLLAMLLLGGWTTMINTQRYKDSIRTVQAFIQEQYNLVYNVENGRGDDLACNEAIVTETGGAGQARGQSSCVLMGRYLHIRNGEQINVYAVVGDEPADDDADSDITSIRGHEPKRVASDLVISRNELNIPWQATVVGPDGATEPRSVALVILRAPSSGIVHTYSMVIPNDGNLPDVATLVSPANEQTDLPLCLDPGNPLAGDRMGVLIKARAAGQGFIETIEDGADTC